MTTKGRGNIMYKKDLSQDLRLRLSNNDMDFLKGLSNERNVSVSECIRSIIGEYRRSLDYLSTLQDALKIAQTQKEK